MTGSFDIADKVALVTGANRGIGLSIVEAFIAQGAAKVYAAVRRPETVAKLADQYPGKIIPVKLDLSEPATIHNLAEQADDVNVVVNNAGILINAAPLDAEAVEALDRQMQINVVGLLHMAQAFTPVLSRNGPAAFVQLNSVASLRSYPAFATYAASKAAAYSLTQALRLQMAEHNIQVLSVHPGPISTDMANEAGLADIAEPPTVVADGIINALRNGDFHLFPDSMAQQLWHAYQSFAETVIEPAGE